MRWRNWRVLYRRLVPSARGIVLPGLSLVWLGSAPSVLEHRPAVAPALAFTNVTVIDVVDGRHLPAQTVILSGNRIQAMGPTAEIRLPEGANVVNAQGKYLIPGLWDMHIHPQCYPQIFYPLLVAYGVTGIRDASSTEPLDSLRQWRRDIAAGTRVGPRMVVAGQALDQAGPADLPVEVCDFRTNLLQVLTPDKARHAVDSLKAAGADFIKTHDLPNAATYFAVANEARRIGIPFGGHLTTGVAATDASDSGAAVIDHYGVTECDAWASDVVSVEPCARVAEHFRRNGTWYVPTFVIGARSPLSRGAIERFWPDWVREKGELFGTSSSDVPAARSDTLILRSIRLFVRAGMPMLTGTDAAPIFPAFVPGVSLHDEIAAFVWGGLSPLAALQAATLHPAKALHATDSLGTVAPGKVADLVLLDADPLEDINNTMTIRAVIANGRYFDRAALDMLLAEVERAAHP